jgi:hypothetical protein
MGLFEVTTADLLAAWREATRAAELAERLASEALAISHEADVTALESAELAELAAQAAAAAQRAADRARQLADRTADKALTEQQRQQEAQQAATSARSAEDDARADYHKAQRRTQDAGARSG